MTLVAHLTYGSVRCGSPALGPNKFRTRCSLVDPLQKVSYNSTFGNKAAKLQPVPAGAAVHAGRWVLASEEDQRPFMPHGLARAGACPVLTHSVRRRAVTGAMRIPVR